MTREDPENRKVQIFDFNLIRGPIREAGPQSFGLFMPAIRHIFPSRSRMLEVKSSCTSWMIDEDYILGLDVCPFCSLNFDNAH